jgi:hypothetical protein
MACLRVTGGSSLKRGMPPCACWLARFVHGNWSAAAAPFVRDLRSGFDHERLNLPAIHGKRCYVSAYAPPPSPGATHVIAWIPCSPHLTMEKTSSNGQETVKFS